jgi:hypothetical protein
VDTVGHIDDFVDALDNLTTSGTSVFNPGLSYAFQRNMYARDLMPSIVGSHCSEEEFKLAFWRTINLNFVPARADVQYYGRSLDFRFLELPYTENIARSFEHRMFLMMISGYMGLGPKWMREPDAVVFFDGAETPFLLRSAGEDTWKLVGDCYLDDWMDGEYNGHQFEPRFGSAAFDRSQKSGSPPQEASQGMRTLDSEGFSLI